MNRRRFCISGAAAAASLAAAGTVRFRARMANCALSVADYAIATAPVDTVVFDRRFSASRAFGAAAAQNGRRTLGYVGDITALWFHDLGPGWVRGRAAVAGMTTSPALFCLEQLAKDHRMRVKVRVERPHAAPGILLPPNEALVSWIIAA